MESLLPANRGARSSARSPKIDAEAGVRFQACGPGTGPQLSSAGHLVGVYALVGVRTTEISHLTSWRIAATALIAI